MKQVTYIFALLLSMSSLEGRSAAAEPRDDAASSSATSRITNVTIQFTDGTEKVMPIEGGIDGVSGFRIPVEAVSEDVEPGVLDKISKEAAIGVAKFSKEAGRTTDQVTKFFSRLGADIKKGIEEGKIERETRRIKEQVAKEARRLEEQAREAAEKAKKEAKRIGRKLGWR